MMSSSQNQNSINVNGEKLAVEINESEHNLVADIKQDDVISDMDNFQGVKNEVGHESSGHEIVITREPAEKTEDKKIQVRMSKDENITKMKYSNTNSLEIDITRNNKVYFNKIIKEECENVETFGSTQSSKIQPDKNEDSALLLQQSDNSSPTISPTIIEIESTKEKAEMQQQEIIMLSSSKPTSTNKSAMVEATQQPKNKSTETTEGGKQDLASSLWIRNITTATKAADIKALFSKYAKVVTAKIFTTKNKQSPTCFGYVSLTDPESADLCVESLNRLNFKGRIINVEKADRSNLSQINKNSGSGAETKQQQKLSNVQSAKTSRSAAEIMLLKHENTATKQSEHPTRPRITASGETFSRDLSSRRPITSYDTRKRYTSGNLRYRVSSAYSRLTPRFKNQYPIRRVVQTSRGIRVSTTSSYPHNTRVSREEFTTAEADINHHRIASYRFNDSRESHRSENKDADKEEIIRLMRRREEEHRKKEDAFRLEREREKLRYEREKLEREKLELETLKLQTQLAQAAQLQIAGLSANASLSAPSVAVQQFIPQQYATNEIPRRENSESNKERKILSSHLSAKEDRSNSRQHVVRPDSRSHATNDRDLRESRVKEERSHRSRSPIRRSAVEAVIYRGRETQDIKPDRRRDDSRRDERRHAASSRTRGNAKTPTEYYSGTTSSRNNELDHHDRTSSHRRIQSSTTGHNREYFGSSGQQSRYTASNLVSNSYAARTDPSYASRVAHTIGHRPVDEMFGNNAFGMNSQHGSATTNYTHQPHYGREQHGNSSSYFQNTNWDGTTGGGRNNAPSSSRPYNLWNTSSQHWNAYGVNNAQTTSTSNSRFSTSSYGKQLDGSSYTTGRRY